MALALLIICTYSNGCDVGNDLVGDGFCLPLLSGFTKVSSGDTFLEVLCPSKTRGNNIVSAGDVLESGNRNGKDRGAVDDDWVSSNGQREGNESKQGSGREHLANSETSKGEEYSRSLKPRP